jgi:hypothetical protein
MSGFAYVKVNDIPESIQLVLKQVGYNKEDIFIEQYETLQLNDMGGEGRRSFVAMVNIETGENKVTYGSWGGPNAFTNNAVDNDNQTVKVIPGVAIIKGSEGGGKPTLAILALHPDNIVKLLPNKVELSEREKDCLYIVKAYTSAGRKSEFARRGIKQTELLSLAEKGYLKFNKAGAVSITLEGKNAIVGMRVLI